jgi:hypothetical protein
LVDIRDFTIEDIPALQLAIDADKFHTGEWKVEHFQIPGVPTRVVTDSKGPVAFLIYTDSDGWMRVSCVWADDNVIRNARTLAIAMALMMQTAREGGFKGIVMETNHPNLAAFLVRIFGMECNGNEYFLSINKETKCAVLRAL